MSPILAGEEDILDFGSLWQIPIEQGPVPAGIFFRPKNYPGLNQTTDQTDAKENDDEKTEYEKKTIS
jgi:hypothetical protein